MHTAAHSGSAGATAIRSAVVIGLLSVAMLLPLPARADHAGPEAVISDYVKACCTGNVELLKSLFHVDALMTGHSYTDMFTPARLDGQWKIVSKTYYQSK